MSLTGNYESTLSNLLRQVDGKSEQFGWDQPATLYCVYVVDESPEMVMWEVRELEFMRQAYEKGGKVPEILEFMADAVADMSTAIAATRPENLYGYLLVTEGWGLSSDSVSNEEAHRIAAEHRIYQHPERTEQRIYMIHGRDGMVLAAKRQRGCDLEVFDKDTGLQRMGGAVPEGLAQLVDKTFRPRVSVN